MAEGGTEDSPKPVRRRSTNPFLYEDGSLIEKEVLETLERENSEDKDSDSEHTPKAEIPPQTFWTSSRRPASMELEENRLQSMTGSYSEILEKPFNKNRIDEEEESQHKNLDENFQRTFKDMPKPEYDDNDPATPVYEEVDPVQMFLSQERLSAFIARDDSLAEKNHYDSSFEGFNSRQNVLCSPEQAERMLSSGGEVTRQGDMISYIADNLEHKIKMASPGSKVNSFPGSRSSTPNLLKSALDPQIPPLDPTLINDIEAYARHIATGTDALIESLSDTLYEISILTVGCVETYRDAVCKTCDAVDANIKSMYQLMAKCEELSKSMKPIYKLHDQIKEVKRLLDMFEKLMSSSGS